MPKNEHIQKHTFYLRKGDVDFIQDLYAARGVTVSAVIRALVSRYVDQMRDQLKERENE